MNNSKRELKRSLVWLACFLSLLGAVGWVTIVTNLQGRAVEDASPDNGDHLVWQNANSRWEPTAAAAAVDSLTGSDGLTANGEADVAKTGTVTVTPTWGTAQALGAATADGSAASFAHSDHVHQGVIQAKGQAGITVNGANDTNASESITVTPTYGSPAALGSAEADGSNDTIARSDHVHAGVISVTGSDGLAASGESSVAKYETVTVTPTWSATVAAVAGTGAAGSASEFSRGDHSHTGVASITAGPGMIFDVSTGAVIGSVDSANITPTWANVQSPPSVYAGNGMLGDGTLAGGAITLHCDSTAITPTWANVQNQPVVYAGNGMTGDGTLAAGAITLHCDSTSITPTWANVQSKPSVNAGVGMAGGGSLATDVTLHVDSSAITPTWSNLQSPPTFTAGDYLSGGGDLSTNRTFDVEIGSISAAVTPTWSNLQNPPTLTAGDYLSGGGDLSTNRTLDVEIGALSVNVTPTWANLQSIDAEIAALAGLTSAADKGIQFTGAGTAATYDLTAAGKALLDDATAGDQRTTLGVGTGDSPQFTALNVGHASDTTITRTGAGDVAVEGNAVYRAGGTDVPVTDGGTGASTAAAGFDALAPTTTRGDIIYRGATNNARLAIGANGYVLTSNGTDPTWAAASGGGAPTRISGGYVSRSSQQLRYDIDQGNYVWLYESGAWAAHTIPTAGVTVNVSPTTLTPGAEGLACYAYVHDSNADGAVDTLTVTTTAPTTQDGINVCTGYTDRLCVARCAMNTGGGIDAWNDNVFGTSDPRRHYIYNYYNRRMIALSKTSTTASWTYQGNWQSLDNGTVGTANRIEIVLPSTSVHVVATTHARGFHASNNAVAGVGVGSTSANSAQCIGSAAGGVSTPMRSTYTGPGYQAGYNYFQALEGTYDNSSGAATFYGLQAGGTGGVNYYGRVGIFLTAEM